MVYAIAAIVILDNLGVDVTGLVAGLGIGGIAIGLAAQGIFSDLFAALSIIFDRPFRVGDVVGYGTSSGTVEAIGLKSTRVRAVTGELLIISNAKLLGPGGAEHHAPRPPPADLRDRRDLPDPARGLRPPAGHAARGGGGGRGRPSCAPASWALATAH